MSACARVCAHTHTLTKPHRYPEPLSQALIQSPAPFQRVLLYCSVSSHLVRERSDSAGLDWPTRPPMLTLSLACGLCVGGSSDQAAFLAPNSSSFCWGPRLASFPCIFLAGTGPQHPHSPGIWERNAGLGCGHGHITGSRSDWSEGVPRVSGRKLTFPPSRPSFPGRPPCHSSPFQPTHSSPTRQGPLTLNHISASPGQRLLVLPRTCSCCPLLSESSLGLSAWARLSPILASSEASRLLGHVSQCPWLSPHLPGSPVRSGLYLSLRLALLSPQ